MREGALQGSRPEAMEACMAMKPEERPMSLTKPMPWSAEAASTLAASSAVCASSTAVSNPKHLSICKPHSHSNEAVWPHVRSKLVLCIK